MAKSITINDLKDWIGSGFASNQPIEKSIYHDKVGRIAYVKPSDENNYSSILVEMLPEADAQFNEPYLLGFANKAHVQSDIVIVLTLTLETHDKDFDAIFADHDQSEFLDYNGLGNNSKPHPNL